MHTYSIFLCLNLSVISSSSSAFSLPKICCNHLVSAILLILFLFVHVYHFCVYLYIIFIESWEREEINIGTLSFILIFFSWNEDKNGLCRSCIYLFIQEILSACYNSMPCTENTMISKTREFSYAHEDTKGGR